MTLLEFITLDDDSVKLAGLELTWSKVVHKPESRAYRLTSLDGYSVVYSGDTDFSEELIEFAMEADILICESALPDSKKVTGHLTPSLAGEIASEARVRTLVLTHFYPECDKVDIISQCRKSFSGNVIAATDLLEIY